MLVMMTRKALQNGDVWSETWSLLILPNLKAWSAIEVAVLVTIFRDPSLTQQKKGSAVKPALGHGWSFVMYSGMFFTCRNIWLNFRPWPESLRFQVQNRVALHLGICNHNCMKWESLLINTSQYIVLVSSSKTVVWLSRNDSALVMEMRYHLKKNRNETFNMMWIPSCLEDRNMSIMNPEMRYRGKRHLFLVSFLEVVTNFIAKVDASNFKSSKKNVTLA